MLVAETENEPVVADPRLWSVDRLHASPLGHRLIAAALAEALGLPGADDSWTHPLPPQPVPARWQAVATEVRWIGTFLGPWLARRIRGRSSGDGRTAKRPEPLPVDQNACPPRNPATS